MRSISSLPIAARARLAANSVIKRAFFARLRNTSMTAFLTPLGLALDCSFIPPSTLHHSTTPTLHPLFLSLHLISQLFGNLFGDAVVGNFVKSYFSIRKLARGLKRLYDLIDALVSRHAVAAHRLSINRVSVFSDVPI